MVGAKRSVSYRGQTKDLLADLGEGEAVASVLAALLDTGGATAHELRLLTRYSAPSVQKALSELEARGWIAKRSVPRPGRGRNPFAYAANPSKAALAKHYKEIWQERMDTLTSLLRQG